MNNPTYGWHRARARCWLPTVLCTGRVPLLHGVDADVGGAAREVLAGVVPGDGTDRAVTKTACGLYIYIYIYTYIQGG